MILQGGAKVGLQLWVCKAQSLFLYYLQEYHFTTVSSTTMKTSKLQLHSTVWMNLTNVILSEKMQIYNTRDFIIPLIHNVFL